MSFTILGTGSALPGRIVTNEELSCMVDTSDEWIRSRTGIRQRRVCSGESLTDLAYQAALLALEDSCCEVGELDLIICATVSADYVLPSLACALQARLGAHCPAFDMNAACTGFLYGLDIAAGYFARNPQQKILLVGADAMSRLVDWQERSTCVLFGDGAGAVVLGPGNDLLAIELSAQGDIAPLYVPNQLGQQSLSSGRGITEKALSSDGWAGGVSLCGNFYGAGCRAGAAQGRGAQGENCLLAAASGQYSHH